jgi:hypothetical protein
MTDKVGGFHILRVCKVFLNSNLVLAGNEVLFLADGTAPGFRGIFQARPGGVIFSPHSWNPEGKLRNLKKPSFRAIVPPFLFL